MLHGFLGVSVTHVSNFSQKIDTKVSLFLIICSEYFGLPKKNLFSILKNVIIVLRKSFETKFVWLVDMFGFSEACLFKVMKSWRYVAMVKMWVSHFTEAIIEELIIYFFCESTENIILEILIVTVGNQFGFLLWKKMPKNCDCQFKSSYGNL